MQHIFPKMNCSYTHLKNKIKQSSITANASIHVIRTDCYQHQRKRNHDEITSSCQTRNVKPHNPSFQKRKTPFSHTHQNIVNFIMNYRPNKFCNISSRRWIAHILIWKTKSSKAASQQMHQYMWYVQTVTSTSANATMMKLPVVAKQEMSHPIIHHFKKTKHHSAMHIKILSIPSWIIVQTYFATYLPEDELLIHSFEKQNQEKQHHSKCINTCDTYILLPASAQTHPWWNYQ